MSITWKGTVVCKTSFDVKNDEYHLLDANDDIVDTLSRPAFLSQPSLRNLPHGRYRRTATQNYGSSSYAAFAGIDPAADDDALSFHPGGISRVRADLTTLNWRLRPGQIPPEQVKPSLKREGIIAGEIIGYRCWRIEKGLLRSVYQKDVWLPLIPLEGRELGDWDSRGIHAWKSAGSKEYHEYIRSYLNSSEMDMLLFGWASTFNLRPAMATGTVLLWGDVVEHERGFRAEFAKVRSLDWLYPDETMMGRELQALNDLRRIYDV